MELPEQALYQESSTVPALTRLAAKVCTRGFNPFSDYAKALHHMLNSPQLPADENLKQVVAQALISHAALPLQSLLNCVKEFAITCDHAKKNNIPDYPLTKYGIFNVNIHSAYNNAFFNPDPTTTTTREYYFPCIQSPDKQFYGRQHDKALFVHEARDGRLLNRIPLTIIPGFEASTRPIGFTSDNKIVIVNHKSPQGTHMMVGYNALTHDVAYEILGYCSQISETGNEIVLLRNGKFKIYNGQTGMMLKDLRDIYGLVDVTPDGKKCIGHIEKYERPNISFGNFYVHDLYTDNYKELIITDETMKGWLKNYSISNDSTLLAALYNNTAFEDVHWFAPAQAQVYIWNINSGNRVSCIDLSIKNPHELRFSGFFDNNQALILHKKKECIIWNIAAKTYSKFEIEPASVPIKKVIPCSNEEYLGAILKFPKYLFLRMHPTYKLLAKDVPLKELQALLILEYDRIHHSDYNPVALQVIQKSNNKTIQLITQNRYIPGKTEYKPSLWERFSKNAKENIDYLWENI